MLQDRNVAEGRRGQENLLIGSLAEFEDLKTVLNER